MLEFMHGKVSNRKFWLFGCACCRRIWHLLLPVSQKVVELGELYADDRISHDELLNASLNNHREVVEAGNDLAIRCGLATNLAVVDPSRNGVPSLFVAKAANSTAEKVIEVLRRPEAADMGNAAFDPLQEQVMQAKILRDVFGNPFKHIESDPASLTPTMKAFAAAIYDQQAFDRLPSLAQRLEKDSWPDDDILNHFRQPGVHARGCWALDAVLGKE
jgi:hypothetical protein